MEPPSESKEGSNHFSPLDFLFLIKEAILKILSKFPLTLLLMYKTKNVMAQEK